MEEKSLAERGERGASFFRAGERERKNSPAVRRVSVNVSARVSLRCVLSRARTLSMGFISLFILLIEMAFLSRGVAALLFFSLPLFLRARARGQDVVNYG